MTSPLPDPILLAGGCPRSGTTLLRNMLASHTQIAIGQEAHFMCDVFKSLQARGMTNDLQLAWEKIRKHPFFLQWGVPEKPICEMLVERPPKSYADLIRVIFAALAASQNKPFAADKTPNNALMFELLGEMFPTSKFVHLLRDPREVCTALAVQDFSLWDLAGAALWWRLCVSRARRAAAILGDRWLEIRYENLVARPREELERLCAHIGLAFEEDMLAYHQRSDLLQGSVHTFSRQPPKTGLRRWQEEMTRADVGMVQMMAGSVMEQVGYQRVRARPTPRALQGFGGYALRLAAGIWVEKRWGTYVPVLPPRRLAASPGPSRPLILSR